MAYSAGSLGAVEHVLVPRHLPYRHDNLGVASVPRLYGDWPKTSFLVSPRERESEIETLNTNIYTRNFLEKIFARTSFFF